MKAHATVRLNFDTEKQLNVVIRALKPETETSSTRRSKASLRAEGQMLILEFQASDTSALRAAMNSYLRLIVVAMNLQKFTQSS